MINFYDIVAEYPNYLRRFEPRIPLFNYQSNQKFLCGVVLQINGASYYAPVSHNTNEYPTSFMIRRPNNHSQILGSIRFNYMFPVLPEFIQQKDYQSMKIRDPLYYALVTNELTYCQSCEAEIHMLAEKVYRWGTNPNSYHYRHCCDFKKLENVYRDYPDGV